jgi:hypothetical protein
VVTQGASARATRPHERHWDTHLDNGLDRIAWELANEAVENSRKVRAKLRELRAAIERLEASGADRRDTGVLTDGITHLYLDMLEIAAAVGLGVGRRFDWEKLWKDVTSGAGESWDWATPPTEEASS